MALLKQALCRSPLAHAGVGARHVHCQAAQTATRELPPGNLGLPFIGIVPMCASRMASVAEYYVQYYAGETPRFVSDPENTFHEERRAKHGR